MKYYKAILLLIFTMSGISFSQESLYGDWEKKMFTSGDTIDNGRYTIVRTVDTVDTSIPIYSVVIFNEGNIVYRIGQGAERREWCRMGLYPILQNERKQLVIEIYSGGANCCASYWILDLSENVEVLYEYDAQSSGELGRLINFVDLDGDGNLEFIQLIDLFGEFDGLSHAESPGSLAVFKYSIAQNHFVLANKSFSKLILSDTSRARNDLRQLMANPDQYKDYERRAILLSCTLDILLAYVFAGQENLGWHIFDQLYTLNDKEEIKRQVIDILRASSIYNDLYSQ